ncbi:dynein heavy chain domain-containing protein 1 [Anableps anableps]
MTWCMWRRSRTICLSLAIITVFLHLLLVLVTLSIPHLPCDTPLPPDRHFRDLAHNSERVGGHAELPTDTLQRDSSNQDGEGEGKINVQRLPYKRLTLKGDKHALNNTVNAANQMERWESDLLKLKALFDHPLYNMPRPTVTEDDWLLKVKPKIKPSQTSSQMWKSDTQDGYDDVQWNSSSSSQPPWLRFHLGITRWELYPHRDPNMEPLTQQLATHRIVSAVQKTGGTQLKLVMSFPNYGQALFKPKKILGYRRIPPAVGRLVDVVKEIKDVTTDRKLAKTFFNSPVGNVCFFGQCSYYCSTEHAVCGTPRDLEASLAMMLPDVSLAKRRSWKSPWRRSYSRNKLAQWETDPNYCETVKKTPPYDKGTRLVDFIDLVILDFLMKFTARYHNNELSPWFHSQLFPTQVGSKRVIAEAKWADEPRLISPTSGTDIPSGGTPLKEESLAADELTDVSAGKRKRQLNAKIGSKLYEYPLTGIDVCQMLAEKRDMEELFYLKKVDEDTYRPYDLQVVRAVDAGPEHYVFSPNSVLHVTATGFGGVVSLRQWYREYVLWTALQDIHFFRNFRLHKAFSSWRKTVHRIHFQRKCDELQDLLLPAVPQFRTALHLLSGVLEELKGRDQTPLEDSKSFSLLEFNKVLLMKNKECLRTLQKLSKYQAELLNVVKEESYKNHKELQTQLKLAKTMTRSHESIHLLLAHQQRLKKQLAQSESILRKLGNFAALVHQMIVQSLVTVVKQDASSFLKSFKRVSSEQCSVFYTELCFSANSQLTIVPPICEFHKTLKKSFLRADNIVQICDNLGFFLEISNKVCNSDEHLTSDLSRIRCSIVKVANTAGLNNQPTRAQLLQSSFLMVQGKMVNGCYYPLSKKQLEWYMSVSDVIKQAEAEHAKIIQDSELEIEQVCKRYGWLKEIHLFVSQWSPASLEAMKGQPASVYEELIKKLHHWAQRIHTVSPSTLQQLTLIKEQVQDLLVDQMKRQSETLIADLERMTAGLRTEPDDVYDFSQYTFTVRELEKMLADIQSRLEYILSLRDTICVVYRKMTEQELTLEEKMLALWDDFIVHLKEADKCVSQSLSSVTSALDTIYSCLACDLKNIVFKATSGPFLDPSQNANEMVSKLKYMVARVQMLSTKLEELHCCSQRMQEQQLDLTVLAADVNKILARKELWQLKAECTAWIEEWHQLPLSEVAVSQALEKIAVWKNQTLSLTTIIPAADAVLEETSGVLKNLSHHAKVLAKLKSSGLTEKHWEIIFQDLETHFSEIQKDLLTLSTMLKSRHSVEFRLQLEDLVQFLKDLAKLLDLFERYQQMWAFLTKIFRGTSNYDRLDLLEHFQQVDDAFKKLMQSVSTDPHVWNFVYSEIIHKHDGEILCKILMDGLFTMEDISSQMKNLFQTFREQFLRLYFLSDREIMQLLSFHPVVLKQQSFLHRCFKGVHLLEVELKRLSHASNLGSFTPSSSSHPQNPEQMKVLGVFGSLWEHVAFQPPLGPNSDILVWLCTFEKHLKLSMEKLIKQCTVVRGQLEPVSKDLTYNSTVSSPQSCSADKMEDAHPLLDLLLDFPLQCLLVVEEAFWCRGVLQAFQERSPLKLNNLKTNNSSKLKILGNAIRNRVLGTENKYLISKYAMMCLRALVQLAMNHEQQLSRLVDLPGVPESSFEWLSMMKYHINSEDEILDCSDNPSCYVDILDHHFQYGFEYYGPDDWLMVQTPTTNKATLGIFLALTRYRPGFVSGLSMSGRTNTVIQLGKALGQLVVVKQCCPSMASDVVQQMLLGAIQAGAWLLLESVDLLPQGVLSLLGQLLTDINYYYLNLKRNKNQMLNKECKTAPRVTGCINISDPECHFELLGKKIFPNASFGCLLTSSNQYASKIPDSLRFATRPVSLTHPDYRIVAEVTLASIGFLEAWSLSHRLVCLITLIKDSECLPGLFNGDQSCFLVVLQKLISASETYLHHVVSQRDISIQAKVIAPEESDPLSVESLPDKRFVKDRKETTKLPKLRNSYLLAIQALMEETAIVKAILSVLIPEHKKTSQFYTILKDTFPIVSQFPDFQKYIQEREKNQLQDAVEEELEDVHLYCDMEVIKQTLALYQALKFSQTVILIGPSGSGKTTCYTILAGALNRLATTSINNRDASHVDPQIPALKWCYVDTLVLFPNAMSHNELFGCSCEKRGWKDGAVTKVLKDSGRYNQTCFETYINDIDSEETSLVKWLVMDGEPIGQPCWLDYLTTLCSSQDPHLYLSSGETMLYPSQLSLLLEMTDLRVASPSAVTRCGIVYFMQTDLWKAIWKSEMDALSIEYKLEQGVQKMWNRLAHDLFSSTLSLLEQHSLTSANHFESGSCENFGLQEITSFVRILRALLQSFVKRLKKPNTILQKDSRGETNNPSTNAQGEQELLFRNLFLVAYVWGFGGHLHFRHWPQFGLLARKVLFTSRYKIQVPEQDSLFEYFISNDSKICRSETHLTDFITPKFRTYRYLLNLMLEANQPVLLAGEPGFGRTTLSNSLISFDLPHINIAASPLLTSRDLRLILKNICRQRDSKDNICSTAKQSGLLLFVDDLHEVPCDVFGKASTALETLRQSISKREVLTFDSHFFESLNSEAVSYLTTTNISGLGDLGNDGIPLRLSRLFSIFVLPGISEDAILSFHSTWLKTWLREMPLSCSAEEMSTCIITATKSLYDAVRDHFQPTLQRPFYIFSYHDIQKVFSGMYLWQHGILNTETQKDRSLPSGSLPSLSTGSVAVLDILLLWMHECMRTFGDRLCSDDEINTFLSLVDKTAATYYACHLLEGIHMDTLKVEDVQQLLVVGQNVDATHFHQARNLAGQSDLQRVPAKSRFFSTEEASLKSSTVETEIFKLTVEEMTRLVYAPEFSEASKSVKQRQNIKDRCLYWQQDFDVLQQKLRALIDKEVDYAYNITTRYIVHRRGMSQLLHILRALLLHGGHGVLIGSDRITGRKTAVRLAACITGYKLIELDSSNETEFHKILKEARTKTIVDGINVILLVHENISPPVREELLTIMAQRAFRVGYREEKLSSHVFSVTSLKRSSQYIMESWINEKSLGEDYRNVHVFLLMPFTKIVNGEISTNKETQVWSAQIAKALKLSCCVEVYQPWSSQTLAELAVQCLRMCPFKITKECSEDGLSVAMTGIHQSSCQHASVFLKSQPFGPPTYLEFLACFSCVCNKLHNQWQSKHMKSAFLSGFNILSCLNQSDLEEVRHYRDPPDGVVKIMDAICLMFNHPAGWESAKQLLGQSNFFQELEFFECSSLTTEQLQQLGQIVQSPHFEPESVREVSKACESLCRWVLAMYEHCLVQHSLLVRQQLKAQAAAARAQLDLLKQHLKEANQCYEDMELLLQNIRNKMELLRRQLYKAEDLEEEATRCAVKSEIYSQNWRTALQESELRRQNIPGDALILAATTSYLGPFGVALRTDLLSKWRELCQTGSIDINPKDIRTSVFTNISTESITSSPGFPITLTERLQLPLGWILEMNEWQLEDTLSARLMVKLLLWGYNEACVHHWPLLADADQHFEISSQKWFTTGGNAKLEKELGFGLVLCADDLELLEKLDFAAGRGWKVLVTHVERAKSNPEFLAKLVPPRRSCFHGLQQPPQPVHPDFRLFLSTPLPVRLLSSVIDPSILAQVLVVDLSLSPEEIRELMLTQLLQSDRRALLIQHARFQNYNQSLQAKLVSAEEALMDYILQSDQLLFRDPGFLPRMAVCQEETKKLQAEMKQLREELDYHESLMAPPRQLMKLAAALYQALQAMSHLSPAYYFSLKDFMKVMQEALSEKSKPFVSYSIGKTTLSILPEIMNMMVNRLLLQYRPLLFKRHFAVLKLLASLAMLEHNQLCSEAEKMVFLRGLEDIKHNVAEVKTSVSTSDNVSHSHSKLPSWIPSNVHSELLLLEKIPCFKNLIDSLYASPTQWQEYLYLTSSTVVGKIACCSHSHLSLLQRAILWKTIHPDSLQQLGDDINACLLCLTANTAAAPHYGNPDVLSKYLARFDGPIILTLPNPDRNIQISIQPLYFIHQLAHKDGKNKVQVKVICFGGLCDKELTLSMLDKARSEGQWLVFTNCHLLENWDNDVVVRLGQLTSSSKDVVRMCALRLCCDSSWDLREEISCSFQQVLSVCQPQLWSDVTDDNMEVLLRCAIFHSILVQRQTYKYLSFGRMYHWSQADLLTLLDAYMSFASVCHDKFNVLRYIAANVVHGGHITDSTDSEVVESVAKCCFATKSFLSGSGPCILLDMINSCSHYDLSGLLKVLEQRFRDLAISDPVVLGFSANTASEVAKINSYNLNVLLQASQAPLRTVNLPSNIKAKERLQALKNYLTHKKDSTIKDVGAVCHSPLRDFLEAEWDDLIDLVSLHLSHLQQPVWYNWSSASLLKFTELSRLEKRAELLSAYLGYDGASHPPGSYRLAAFKKPRGFLLALMQEAARENYKYVSDIVLHFQVLFESPCPPLLPLDSVCLCGLELTGASWDPEIGALQETISPQPFSVPLLFVKAHVRNTNSAIHTLSSKSSYLTDIGNLEAAPTASHLQVYHCPLYLNKECESGIWGLSDVNMITKVPLHSKLSPALCSLRRVRLVSTL